MQAGPASTVPEDFARGQAAAVTAARLQEEEKWKHLTPDEAKAARHRKQEEVHRHAVENNARLEALHLQQAKLEQEAVVQQAAMLQSQADQLQVHQQQQQQQQQQLLQQQQQQKDAVAEQQLIVHTQALAIADWESAIQDQQRQQAVQSLVPVVKTAEVDVDRVRERSTSPHRSEERAGRWRTVAANAAAAAAAEGAAAAAKRVPLPGAVQAAAEARESRR
jgi:hypothetical protein